MKPKPLCGRAGTLMSTLKARASGGQWASLVAGPPQRSHTRHSHVRTAREAGTSSAALENVTISRRCVPISPLETRGRTCDHGRRSSSKPETWRARPERTLWVPCRCSAVHPLPGGDRRKLGRVGDRLRPALWDLPERRTGVGTMWSLGEGSEFSRTDERHKSSDARSTVALKQNMYKELTPRSVAQRFQSTGVESDANACTSGPGKRQTGPEEEPPAGTTESRARGATPSSG